MADSQSGSRIEWIYKTGTDFDSILLKQPPETLKSVLDYVDGFALLQLWKCGNKFLNYLIGKGGGCKYFGLYDFAFHHLKWPKLIYDLQRLESLRIRLIISGRHGTVRNVDIKSLPKSLKTLKLAFKDAEDAVCCPEALKRGVREYLDLKTLFPELQDLVLEGETNTLIDSIAEVFPPTLTNFQTHSTRLEPSFLTKVPADVDTLRLPRLMGVENFTELPRSLTRLQLPSELTDDNIVDLPATLLTLVLTGTAKITDEKFKLLPPRLLHLVLMSSPYLTGACLKHLPRTMIIFHTLKLSQVTTADLRQLPPNLTAFNCGNFQLKTPLEKDCLPPKLSSFSAITSYLPISLEDLSCLPTQLRTLSLRCVDSYNATYTQALPRNLVRYILKDTQPDVQDDAFASLPSKLLQLELTGRAKLTDMIVSHLPASLTHFSCSSSHITEACFAALPPGLIHLRLPLITVEDPLSITKLPRRLVVFIIQAYLPGEELPPIDNIPPLLRVVQFGDPENEAKWIEAILKQHHNHPLVYDPVRTLLEPPL